MLFFLSISSINSRGTPSLLLIFSKMFPIINWSSTFFPVTYNGTPLLVLLAYMVSYGLCYGGAGEGWTLDTRIANAVLSQLSYSPTKIGAQGEARTRTGFPPMDFESIVYTSSIHLSIVSQEGWAPSLLHNWDRGVHWSYWYSQGLPAGLSCDRLDLNQQGVCHNVLSVTSIPFLHDRIVT